MSIQPPCILLYNPISGHGHLDSWNAMFVSLLLDAGWRVNVATPDAKDLLHRLQLRNQASSAQLHVLEWNVLQRSFFQRVVGRLHRLIRPAAALEAQGVELDPRYLDPGEFGERLTALQKKCKWPPAIAFNMYMDMYAPDAKRWGAFDSTRPLPWAGIRFVPSQTATEAYYQLSSLTGMCFLDESLCQQYQALLPQKVFEYLPDITENALPATQSELVRQINERAKGRKIVFLGGTIGGNKNLSKWYQLVSRADASQWYFVQIGEMFEDTLSQEDAIELAKIKLHCPENLYIKLEYLPDEAMFNEVINASDIIFAVYRNFTISSNMPGKAAAFNKPILVADGHLMGQRVAQYGLGAVVVQDDVTMMLSALQALVHPSTLLAGNFQAYRSAFSMNALGQRLIGFLHTCIAQSKQPNRLRPR